MAPVSKILQLTTSATVARATVKPGQRIILVPSVATAIAFGDNNTTPSVTGQVMATGTLTSDDVFLDTETVVIDGVTYTFRTVLGVLPNSVLIGANQTASHLNLQRAINRSLTGLGTTHTIATVEHPTVWSSAVSGTTTVVLAKEAGVVGNSIATTETCGHAAWGAATLASGAGEYGQLLLAAGETVELSVPYRQGAGQVGRAVTSISAVSANGTLGIIIVG